MIGKILYFLKDPLIPQNTGNRENIYLAAELCNYRRKDGSISLDRRDFNSFAERVKQIIGSWCTIVYIDFVCHIGLIVEDLRNRDIKAICYNQEYIIFIHFNALLLLGENEGDRQAKFLQNMGKMIRFRLLWPHVHLALKLINLM